MLLKVSVITVCYNSADYIESAIQSVVAQTYADIEYIIVDGGSCDGTKEIIKSYGKAVAHFVSEPDKGIYDAMNKGLSLATGEVIGLLNSDDFYPRVDVITDVVRIFVGCPKNEIVLGNVDFVNPNNLLKPIRLFSSFKFSPWKMRFGFSPAHPAAFMRRAVYQKVGKYDSSYRIGADFEWFVRAFVVHKIGYVFLNKVIVRMREGGVSTSGVVSYWISSRELLHALRENGVYSNWVFVLMRLPIKLIHKLLRKG